ncbi:MAG: YIP1 family protein [Candidatus Marinimicrobia bacterium]|nr:YIP1 family protein [Candidatus Neomarinimicrobiota bacterium]
MENTSFLQRIIDLFFTPSKAFDGLVDGVSYKDWLYPLLIVAAGLVILPLFYRDISLDEGEYRLNKIIRSIENNADMSEEQKAAYLEKMYEGFDKVEDARDNPFAFRNMWGYFLLPVMLFVMTAFFAAILLLVGNFGMGGKVKFFQMFTMVMMTYLIGGNGFFMNMIPGIGTLELMVKTPMIIIKESTNLVLSPGLLFDEVDSFFQHFLNQLDIFRIWGMVVMGFGFARLYNKSTATGMMSVGFPWLILVSIGAALMKANSAAMGSLN